MRSRLRMIRMCWRATCRVASRRAQSSRTARVCRSGTKIKVLRKRCPAHTTTRGRSRSAAPALSSSRERAPSHTARSTRALLGELFRDTLAWAGLPLELSPADWGLSWSGDYGGEGERQRTGRHRITEGLTVRRQASDAHASRLWNHVVVIVAASVAQVVLDATPLDAALWRLTMEDTNRCLVASETVSCEFLLGLLRSLADSPAACSCPDLVVDFASCLLSSVHADEELEFRTSAGKVLKNMAMCSLVKVNNWRATLSSVSGVARVFRLSSRGS